MLLVFPSQKGFVWVFRGCAPRRVQEGSLPPIQPRIPRRSTNPTHRFCYRALLRRLSCPFGQALFSLLVTHPARPRPAGGRRMLLVLPSQKGFVWVFRGCAPRRVQEGSLPPIQPRIPRRSTNPTHRFCYRAQNTQHRKQKRQVSRAPLSLHL